jgi:hypothetical protein
MDAAATDALRAPLRRKTNGFRPSYTKEVADMIKYSFAVIRLAALVVQPSLAQDLEATEPNEEDLAWKDVDGMDREDLTAFLRDFPTGTHAEKANFYLALVEKIAAIQDQHEEPEFLIVFEEFGERWKAWEARRPDRGSVGIFSKKTDSGATLGIFSPLGGPTTFSFDEYGTPVIPTGDGSLVAVRTNGLQFEWVEGLSIKTPGDSPVYFGVIDDLGLAYLHGEGTVYLGEEQFDLPGAKRQGPGRASDGSNVGFRGLLGGAILMLLAVVAVAVYIKSKRRAS